MMEMVDHSARPAKLKKVVLALSSGAFLGFFGGLAIAGASKEGLFGEVGPSVDLALGVALLYILVALAVLVGVLSPAIGEKFLNVEDADELREQKTVLAYSVVGMILLGLALAVAALSGPGGVIGGRLGMVSVVVLVLAAVVVCWRQWRYVDEFTRTVSREAISASYMMVATVGGGWSLLAHVEEVPPPSPLDWLTMIWGFVILGSFAAAGRRGMLRQR